MEEDNEHMKNISTMVSIALLSSTFAPYTVLAQEYTNTTDPRVLACMRSLKLLPSQLETGFYDYHIDRCKDEQSRRNDAQQRLKRISLRAETIQNRLTRNSRGILYNALPSRVIVNTGPVVSRPSRRAIIGAQSTKTNREQRAERSLTRRLRSAKARTSCIAVDKSFRENCVRDAMRRLGSE